MDLRRCRKTLRSRHRTTAIELLETRRLLLAISWIGNSGNWNNPANWSGGVVPQSADLVSISSVGAKVNITTADAVGTLSVAVGAQINIESTGTPTVASGGSILGSIQGSGGNLNLQSTLDNAGQIELHATA
jgi:hypothetical protein